MGDWREIKPAKRTEKIKYAIRDIVVLAKEVEKTGKEMLYLNIGDPNIYDFETPKFLIDRTIEAMNNNRNGYAPSSGIQEAVDAIRTESILKGFKSVHDIFVTTGASEAIDIALTALLDPGDQFLLPAPTYPLYNTIINKLNAETKYYYLDENNNWEPDLDDIESKITEKTKGILIINPNNPTGTNYSEKSLKGVLDIAKKHNLLIFSDEIYEKLLFDNGKHISLATLDGEAPIITFNGLSKSHMVPGFRIGWGIVTGAKEVVCGYNEAMQKLVRARLSANHPEQYAIKPALLDQNQPHFAEMLEKLTVRRDITFKRLNEIKGVSLVKPQGAFYAFAKLDLDVDDTTFCNNLLKETGVVVVPGSGFGQVPGTNHFRVVFLPNEEILLKAYDQIESFIKKHY
ncbi:aminotransferase class I/II-fold pyridoxal phosphate-dependent enzyme [bacterium]|nr:aminotransferase class I/II-fold pyridoxal phosphate-dependent enzyme [bacterium]